MALPEDIVNRSLDAVGCADQQIGSMTSGTRAAQVALRHYIPCLEQLLRGAHWNFARKQAPMVLLGAAPGYATPPNSNVSPVGCNVIPPWTYEYAWPIDCVQARFVPWNNDVGAWSTPAGNISVPPVPPTTAGVAYQTPPILIPAKMLVANDPNYPLPAPALGPSPEWWLSRGTAPEMRTVVLCNVPCAELVYTAFIPYPSLWDALFEEAMVALLATHLALPLNPDKKEGRALRAEQIAIAKAAIGQARVRDGDEGWPSTEHTPDWIRARSIGSGWGTYAGAGAWGDGPGVWSYGWSGVAMGGGAVY